MKKLIWFIVLAWYTLVWCGLSYAATVWTADLNQDGSGGACENGGVCSVAELNALSGDYSGTIFYVKGTISSEVDPNIYGTSSNQVIFDGWEGGSCTPKVSTCSGSATTTAKWSIDEDYITIKDMRWNKGGYGIEVGLNKKVTGFQLLNNYFNNSAGGEGSAFEVRFMCDSLVDGNYFYSSSTVDYFSYNFTFSGGSRNTFTNNWIYRGTVGMYFKTTTQFYGTNPEMENDPDFNIEDNIVAYNYVEESRQEGISFDVSADISTMELDTVNNINGAIVTLNHANWSGQSGLYVGYYMVVVENDNDVFGQHSIITGHQNAVFTLDEALTGLEVGDYVTIQLVYRHNWVHHNTLDDVRFAPTAIVFDAGGLENLIEYNDMANSNDDEGITIQSLFAYAPEYTGSDITGTNATGVAAFNVVRNNNMYRVRMYAYDKNYGSPYYAVDTRNNAVYDNTLTVGIDSTLAYTYYNNNTLGIEQDGCAPGCTMSPDPTSGITGWPFTLSISNPIPADNATGMSTSMGLSFTRPRGDDDVDVYIEEKSGSCDLQVGDRIEDDADISSVSNADLLTFLGLSGALDADTTYCWRVDVNYNTTESLEGGVLEFTTAPGPPPDVDPEDGVEFNPAGKYLRFDTGGIPLVSP